MCWWLWIAGNRELFIFGVQCVWYNLETCSKLDDSYSADPSIITDDFFLQFDSSLDYSKSRRSFMLLIWFASSWVI